MPMKPRVGLAVVGNEAESGLERAGSLLKVASDHLRESNVDVILEQNTIVNEADAVQAARRFREAGVDLTVLIHATWTRDSIPYLFMQGTGNPIFLWAVPYPETYSLAAVQHFAGILRNRGIGFKYAYGLSSEAIDTVVKYARVVKLVNRKIPYHIGLIVPRPTWRAFGPQDMTGGEWDLSELLHTCIVHIEMEEFQKTVGKVEISRQKVVVKEMKEGGRLPEAHVMEEERLLRAAAEYLAIKELRERYQLDAVTVATYPYMWGIVNLAASWLADEGFVVETEGDLVRTILMCLIGQLAVSPAALAELAKFDSEANVLYLGHAGSAAVSLAESLEAVKLVKAGSLGCFVQFPLKRMPEVTVVNLWQGAKNYSLFTGLAASRGMSLKEWEDMGGGFLAKLDPKWSVESMLDFFIAKGMEHHFVLAEGDLREELADLADLLGIEILVPNTEG